MDLIFLKSLRPLYCDYISRILCVRRAQQGRPPRPPFMYFYSRPYARGDLGVQGLLRPLAYFYSRSYARGDSRLPIRCWTSCHFYSRPYVRGDLRLPAAGSAVRCNFYSRPYARGGSAFARAQRPENISTPAPTRWTTHSGADRQSQRRISTPAPTRGATAIFHKTTS